MVSEHVGDILTSLLIKIRSTRKVHIIQVRELRALNWDGTSDPRVHVQVDLGDTPTVAKTRVEKSCTSCIFDEHFSFRFPNVSAHDLAKSRLRVTVQDDNTLTTDTDIGTWAIDLLQVYRETRGNGAVHSASADAASTKDKRTQDLNKMLNKMTKTGPKDERTRDPAAADHEIYREWIGLVDRYDAKNSGIVGFVQLSVLVLGPHDWPPLHDVKKEMADRWRKENLKRKKSMLDVVKRETGRHWWHSGDAGAHAKVKDVPEGPGKAMLISMPEFRKELKFLVVSIYRAEGVPTADEATFYSPAKIDAYVEVHFGNSPPVRTKTRTVKSLLKTNARVDIEWNVELWIPVLVPTRMDFINISLWDRDYASADDLVAQLPALSFASVGDKDRQKLHAPHWVNM